MQIGGEDLFLTCTAADPFAEAINVFKSIWPDIIVEDDKTLWVGTKAAFCYRDKKVQEDWETDPSGFAQIIYDTARPRDGKPSRWITVVIDHESSKEVDKIKKAFFTLKDANFQRIFQDWREPDRTFRKGRRWGDKEHKSCCDCQHFFIAGLSDKTCSCDQDVENNVRLFSGEASSEVKKSEDGKTFADKCEHYKEQFIELYRDRDNK